MKQAHIVGLLITYFHRNHRAMTASLESNLCRLGAGGQGNPRTKIKPDNKDFTTKLSRTVRAGGLHFHLDFNVSRPDACLSSLKMKEVRVDRPVPTSVSMSERQQVDLSRRRVKDPRAVGLPIQSCRASSMLCSTQPNTPLTLRRASGRV